MSSQPVVGTIQQLSGINLRLMAWDDLGQPRYPIAVGRANGYLTPRGGTPGVGYVLLAGSDWLILRDAGVSVADPDIVSARQKVRPLSSPVNLTLGAGNGSVLTLSPLWVTWAKKISGGAETLGNPDATYMLRLTDRRWLDRMVTVNKQYNVRAAAPPATTGAGLYLPNSLNSGSVWTWATMCQDLWTTCIDQSFSSLPFSPHLTPEGFQFQGVSAMEALEVVLNRIDCHLTYDVATDTYAIATKFQTSSQLTTLLQNEPPLIDDQEGATSSVALLPENIKVHFRVVYKHYGTEDGTSVTSGNWLTKSVHVETVATGLAGAIAETTIAIWDDLPCILNFDGTIFNQTDLTNRANERADNWTSNITECGGRQYTLYRDIIYLFPDSQVAGIHWRNTGEGLVTQLYNFPGRFDIEDNWEDGWPAGKMALHERLEPPDFQRFTTPSWPPLLQHVVIDGTTGTQASPDSRGLFAAHVLRTDPEDNFSTAGPYHTNEACWLALSNVYTGSQAGISLMAGERYLARLNGSATDSGSTTLPLYLLHRENNEIYHVTLASPIAAGNTGSVLLPDGRTVSAINWSGTDYSAGDKVQVWEDLTNSTFYVTKAGSGQTFIVRPTSSTIDGTTCCWAGKVESPPSTPTAFCSNQFTDGTVCWLTILNQDLGSVGSPNFQLNTNEQYLASPVGAISGVPVYAIRVEDNYFYHVTIPGSSGTDDILPGMSKNITLPTGETVSVKNNSVDTTLVHGDKGYVELDLSDNTWYGWKSGGGSNAPIIYRAVLTSDLHIADATASIGTVVSLTSAAAPSPTSANNKLSLAGFSGDVVYIVQNTSSGTTYELLEVQRHEINAVVDVTWDGSQLVEHRRKIAAMPNEATDTTTVILTAATQSAVIDVAFTGSSETETKKTLTIFAAGAPTTTTVWTGTACSTTAAVTATSLADSGAVTNTAFYYYYLGG